MTPVADKPVASAAQDSQSSDDDTQPQLPVLDFPIDEPPASAAPEPRAETKTPPVDATIEAAKPAETTVAPNAEAEDAAERQAKDNGSDGEKPEGRLLPWDAPAAEPVEKETSDKDQPDQ
jgi:hypothetical protein